MNENTTGADSVSTVVICMCIVEDEQTHVLARACFSIVARCTIPSLDSAGRLRGITRILMAGAYHGLFNSEIITEVSVGLLGLSRG